MASNHFAPNERSSPNRYHKSRQERETNSRQTPQQSDPPSRSRLLTDSGHVESNHSRNSSHHGQPSQQRQVASQQSFDRCANELCPKPEIQEDDDEPGRGPRGILLCRKCYRRYKLEKKTAREEGRRVTDAWKTPRRKRNVIRDEERQETDEVVGREYRNTNGHVYREDHVPKSTNELPIEVVPTLAARTDGLQQPEPVVKANSIEYAASDLASSTWTDLEKGRRIDYRSSRENRVRSNDRHRAAAQQDYVQRDPSSYDEAEFYKYGRIEEEDDHPPSCVGCCCLGWTMRRKCIVFGVSIVAVITMVTLIAVAVTKSHRPYTYTPSLAQVNNTAAFDLHGATRANVNDTNDGRGSGADVYNYYSGNASNFPAPETWISFNQMWQANLDTIQFSCGRLEQGDDNTPEIMQDIYDAIQDRAAASLVDHRLILATILQESKGCVRVHSTKSYGGVRNPGLMQSHNGHSYDPKHSRLSILNMIQDGTQGTKDGDGLVQTLNYYGDPYRAARAYNSGYIPSSGDLSEAAGATACYVSDIANRLTGWTKAQSTCPGDE